MKGVSKIQLFDSKTKVLMSEYVDENLITNAIKDFLQTWFDIQSEPHHYKNTNSSYLWTFNNPVYGTKLRNFFSGIILWPSEINDTDADMYNINEHPIQIPTGYAADSYSGSNIKRGSLNTTETVLGVNNITFVWDFPTSAANGLISAITLVPSPVGNGGIGCLNTTDMSVQIPMCTPPVMTGSSAIVNSDSFESLYNSNTPYPSDSACSTIYMNDLFMTMNSNTGSCRIFKPPSPFSLNNINIFESNPTSYTWSTTLITQVPVSNYYCSLVSYNDELYQINVRSGYVPVIRKLNTTTLAIMSTITCSGATITNSNTNSCPFAAIMNDRVYILDYPNASYNIKVFNINTGLYIETISAPSSYGIGYPQFIRREGSQIAIIYPNGTTGKFTCRRVLYDGITFSLLQPEYCNKYGVTSYIWNLPSSETNHKIKLFNQLNGSNNNYHRALDLSLYLFATINNLETPVTKTSAQTMKITYQLTW